MLRHWDRQTLPELLAAHGLAGVPEEPFPNDGWSGSRLTLLRRDGERFVLKRTSWAIDWIARQTKDEALREAFLAGGDPHLPAPLVLPYYGAAADGGGAAILMPDLSNELIAWERPAYEPPVGRQELDRVLFALATFHLLPWREVRGTMPGYAWPWCPLRERLTLLTRPTAAGYRDAGLPVGERFLAGWDAFDRSAPGAARDLVASLSADPAPLLDALARLPATGLHGDLKLANVALVDDGGVALIDWQMMTLAPVAVELGWLLVSNVALLPEPPDLVLERYRGIVGGAAAQTAPLRRSGWPPEVPVGPPAERMRGDGGIQLQTASQLLGDWEAQVDLAWIVGLLLRGWRKGLDTEADVRYPWDGDGPSDLAWWCERAVTAADRRL